MGNTASKPGSPQPPTPATGTQQPTAAGEPSSTPYTPVCSTSCQAARLPERTAIHPPLKRLHDHIVDTGTGDPPASKKAKLAGRTPAHQSKAITAPPAAEHEGGPKRIRQINQGADPLPPSKRPKVTVDGILTACGKALAIEVAAQQTEPTVDTSRTRALVVGKQVSSPSTSHDTASAGRQPRRESRRVPRGTVRRVPPIGLVRQGTQYLRMSQAPRRALLTTTPSSLLRIIDVHHAAISIPAPVDSAAVYEKLERIAVGDLHWPTVGAGTWPGSNVIPGTTGLVRDSANAIVLPTPPKLRRASRNIPAAGVTVAGSRARGRFNDTVVRPVQLPPLAGAARAPRRPLRLRQSA